jgi:hypothetical protein
MVNNSINIIKTEESLNSGGKQFTNINKTKESLSSDGQQFHQYHENLSFVLMILMELLTITV